MMSPADIDRLFPQSPRERELGCNVKGAETSLGGAGASEDIPATGSNARLRLPFHGIHHRVKDVLSGTLFRLFVCVLIAAALIFTRT